MLLIHYSNIREVVPKGLADYLSVPVIRGNQTAPAPAYPYVCYNVITLATENNGTWQKHEDGIDRKLVRHVWSVSALAADHERSVELAMRARNWLENAGRLLLKDNGITVQSVTQITNRDNVLSVGYEYKNGFDVIFYAFDEVEAPNANDFIETVDVSRI